MKSAVSRSWPSAAWIIRDAATAIRRRMDAHVLDDMAAGPEPHAVGVGVGVHVPVGQASSSAGSPGRVAKAPCYPSSVDAGWLPSRPASTSWRQGLWWIARSAADPDGFSYQIDAFLISRRLRAVVPLAIGPGGDRSCHVLPGA
jgi:hypothetical protein